MIQSLASAAVLLLASHPTPADPEAPPAAPVGATVDAATARSFADRLLDAGDPFNALTWYRLALHLDPDRPDAEVVRFRMAWAYEAGGRWDAAEAAYGQVLGPGLTDRATWRIAAVAAQDGRPQDADRWFAVLADEELALHPDSPWVTRAPFARGVVALQAHDLPTAARRFAEVPPEADPWGPRAASLATASAVPLPSRSPLLAAVLSTVLPGSGQVYTGHLGDGLMAFAASGVLGAWSYTLVRQGVEQERAWEVGLGAVVGGMATLTWSSNVVGAWRGAHRFDDRQARERADALLAEAWDPALELQAADVALP